MVEHRLLTLGLRFDRETPTAKKSRVAVYVCSEEELFICGFYFNSLVERRYLHSLKMQRPRDDVHTREVCKYKMFVVIFIVIYSTMSLLLFWGSVIN